MSQNHHQPAHLSLRKGDNGTDNHCQYECHCDSDYFLYGPTGRSDLFHRRHGDGRDVPTWHTCKYTVENRASERPPTFESMGATPGPTALYNAFNWESYPSWTCEPACTDDRVCLHHDRCQFRHNSLNESGYHLDCPMRISRHSDKINITKDVLHVQRSQKKATILLECFYAKGAVYRWTRVDDGSFISTTANGEPKRTMGQNQVILRHSKIHFPTSEGVSEVSERANE